MSLERKVARNQLKLRWREYNEGVAKKYRIRFSYFWKDFMEKKGRKNNGSK